MLRLIVLTLLLILASVGVGMISIFPNYRDRYMNNEIKIELVEKEKEEDNDVEQGNRS